MSVNRNARSEDITGMFFSIFFNMNVCCVLPLESPNRGDSNENTQHTIINVKIALNYPVYNYICSYHGVFLGTQERVRDSRGKRAIGVRATEVLLYIHCNSPWT